MKLATGVQVTLAKFDGISGIIKLDCNSQRVYWLRFTDVPQRICHISSSDYDGRDQKTITSGSFNVYLLGVFGDSLYYLNNDQFYIKVVNVTNGNISRSILVGKADYHDLIFVDGSVQPIGELE